MILHFHHRPINSNHRFKIISKEQPIPGRFQMIHFRRFVFFLNREVLKTRPSNISVKSTQLTKL